LKDAWDKLEVKGMCFCLAKWQMSQVTLLSLVIKEYKDDILSILWWDKCPNLKCHKALTGIEWLELQLIEGKEVQGTFIVLEIELIEAKFEL